MSQRDLDRRVARATGERLGTIRNRGFSILTPETPGENDCGPPQSVDWDLVAYAAEPFPYRRRAA